MATRFFVAQDLLLQLVTVEIKRLRDKEIQFTSGHNLLISQSL